MRGDVFKVILIVSLLSLSVLLLPKITSLTGHAVADCVDTDSDGFLDTACTEEDYECGNTRAIVELKKNQKNPDIYANFITYKSKLDGVWLIYKIDITTKEIILVSSNITTDSINPQIYEERIVWQKNVGTTGDEVWKTIIKEGDNDEQIIGGDTETVNPAISKDILVWTQLNEEGDYDIVGKDLFNGNNINIPLIGNQNHPKVSGNTIVFVSDSYGSRDVFFYVDGTTYELATGPGMDSAPDTDGDFIVWHSNENGNWDIGWYQISTGQGEVIQKEGNQKLPNVHKGIVVYMDDSNGNNDIKYIDLTTGEEGQITSDGAEDVTPKIYNNKVTWSSNRKGNFDIYLTRISSSCAVQLGDCDDTNSNAYPGNYELCSDTIDNDCNGEIDEASCFDAEDIPTENLTEFGDFDTLEEDLFSNGTEEAIDLSSSCLFEGEINNLWFDTSIGIEGGDYTDVIGDQEEIYVTNYGDGSCPSTYIEYDIYDTIFDETTGEYFTSNLLGTILGILDYNTEGGYNEGYGLLSLVWPGEDTYYYFIAKTDGGAAISAPILVCASKDNCIAEEIIISDANDYLVASASAGLQFAPSQEDLDSGSECLVDEDCDFIYGPGLTCDTTGFCATTETTNEDISECSTDTECELFYGQGYFCDTGFCAMEEEIDCASMWDCAGIDFSSCKNGIKSRDLLDCSHPDPDIYAECWNNAYLPEFEKTCIEGVEEEVVEEDVPFFTWINIILVLFLLIGYYIWKEKD